MEAPRKKRYQVYSQAETGNALLVDARVDTMELMS